MSCFFRRRALGAVLAMTTGVFAIGVLGVGVGSAGATVAKAAKAKGPASINVGLVGGYLTAYTGYMEALQPQYLGAVEKKFHTKINTLVYLNGPTAQAAFFSGADQFDMLSVGGVTAPSAAGKDVLALFQSFTGGGITLVGSAKYKDTRGSKISDYNGGKWCYTTAGGSAQDADIGAAEAAGLNWSSQQGVAIGTVSAYLPTLQSGQCDITAMSSDAAASAVIQGVGYVVENLNTPKNQVSTFGGGATQIGGLLLGTHAFASQYPAFTQALVTAMLKSQLWVQANADDPNLLYQHFPSQFTSVTSLGSFVQSWIYTSPAYTSTSGIFTQPQFKATVAFETKANLLTAGETVNENQAFSNTYTLNAYKALGLKKPPASGLPAATAPAKSSTTTSS